MSKHKHVKRDFSFQGMQLTRKGYEQLLADYTERGLDAKLQGDRLRNEAAELREYATLGICKSELTRGLSARQAGALAQSRAYHSELSYSLMRECQRKMLQLSQVLSEMGS